MVFVTSFHNKIHLVSKQVLKNMITLASYLIAEWEATSLLQCLSSTNGLLLTESVPIQFKSQCSAS
ncbi:hypothetical protein Hanom_Chr08g00740271 [Helianthus anomalus]